MRSSNPYKPRLIVALAGAAIAAAWLYRPDVRWYMHRLGNDRPEARVAALQHLASSGARASIARENILAKLRDSDPAVRHTALEALRTLGWGDQILPSLIEDLQKSESAHVRICACEVVSLLGSEAREAVPALIELLPDERRDETHIGLVTPNMKGNTVRQAALRALGAIGRDAGPAAPRIVALLPQTDFGIQTAFGIPSFLSFDSDPRLACKTLAAIGPGGAAVVPELVALFNRQPEPNAAFQNAREIVAGQKEAAIVRQRAAYGEYRSLLALVLGRIGSKEAMSSLKPAMNDPDPRVKTQAALAVWRIDRASREEVKSILASQATSGNELAAREAIAAMAEISDYRVAERPRK